MIDTIALTLTDNMFSINKPEIFTPNANYIIARNMQFGGQAYNHARYNPNIALDGYKPHYTLTVGVNKSGYREVRLRIEFSIPKLIYGNNFDEVCDGDFDKIIAKLIKINQELGIIISSKNLEEARVSLIHYSKNIVLSNGTTPYMYIRELNKVNIDSKSDVNSGIYRDNGLCYKLHYNSSEFTVYDKIKDYMKDKISSKRKYEYGRETNQLHLFKSPSETNEVIRLEARLNNSTVIKSILKKATNEYIITYNFKKLYRSSYSHAVLKYYLNEFYSSSYRNVYNKDEQYYKILKEILVSKKMKPIKTFNLFGIAVALDMFGEREMCNMFKKPSQRNVKYLCRQIKGINYFKQGSLMIKDLLDMLENYDAIRLSDCYILTM